jgi:hypothetical protein
MGEIISTTYLMGGLGNQMFQISHAICQGWKNNIPSKFKLSSHTSIEFNQPTKYLNNIFRNIEFTNDIPNTIRIESGFGYKPINPSWETSVEFFGYFQSNKNFLGYDDQIIELFQPTEEFINKVKTLYPEINNERTISLHIRRGDYVSISHIHPVIDKTYIDEAIRQNGYYDTIFIFSDDTDWVRQNLTYNNQIVVSGLENYEELWLMSLCKNNIISNSTFSWWGAFLNKNINKNVYTPSIWFGPAGEYNWEDIYIESWTKINVRYSNGLLIH